MALITGSAYGTITSQEETYIESAPQIYMADQRGSYQFNPDSDLFYWQLSGTPTYPVFAIGCYDNVSLGDDTDVNSVRCDVIGDKDVIQKRNHLELKFTLKSFLPFTVLSKLLNGSSVTTNAGQHTEKFGLGAINNNQYWRFYLPKVYDEIAGDYVAFTLHRCKIIATGEIQMNYGNVWTMEVTVWALADETKPAAQQFATVIRSDLSAV
jgi:hypothetical protein